MTIDDINLLNEKAKTRKDGVYAFRGNYWVVKNNRFIAFSNYHGECYQRFGAFNCFIGRVSNYERKNMLKEWLSAQK